MKLKHTLTLAVVLLLIIGLSACSTSKDEVKPYEGHMAPDFELLDSRGNTVKLSSLRDKTVVISFWSMGCRICLLGMPDLDAFNKSKADDVELLMVNIDTDARKIPTYIENQGYSFEVLFDEKTTTPKSYLLRGVPTTIVVDKGGKIIHRIEGALSKEQLESLVNSK